MKTSFALSFVLAAAALFSVTTTSETAEAGEKAAAAPTLTAKQIVDKVADTDPWGMGGAEVNNAKAVVTEKSGNTRKLVFDGKSRKSGTVGNSLLTFSAPADIAGSKYLQVQNTSDDDRWLYTPDLKRTRRIAGSNRTDAFMGTDFSFADLDGRDLRNSDSVLKADENIGKFECYHVLATPKNADAVYGKIEIWVRKDNFVPLKQVMFGKDGGEVKTFVSREIQKHGGRWFITASRMTDKASGRQTELSIDKLDRKLDIPLDNFSVRALEKN